MDLVCLDHALQNVAHSQQLALTGKVICDRKNGPQVVGRVPPFRGEEAVIEIEPADLSTNIESTADWV